ncbi:uncharacterized protein B0T15DRAFT_185390 [Chaetomium strumarium]|uniref:Uncharacterized protein n=1 Tax=Chaetomium strumarium TaxID=1170767 RepID=A0AAJ0M3I7_9PEZI|nr:hypothetical protein B0T15DRAFT_185390 [Chaetomium strumarium]
MKTIASWALALLLVTSTLAADGDDGYIGYRLEHRGDPESAIYETANTPPGAVLPQEPDVYLNASVSVGHIGIEVDNITAKINVDAQVLNLLRFNAGVDASIDRVKLTIENVSAKVELEARLENVVAMVDDVLSSIDLNPAIATLGKVINNTLGDVGDIIGDNPPSSSSSPSPSPSATSTDTSSDATTTTTIATAAGKRSDQQQQQPRDYNLEHNILYSINDYTGARHTNRILAQNGDIVDEYLDNDGTETRPPRVVGSYATDMSFTGHNRTVTVEGEAEDGSSVVTEFELQYVYAPFPGIEVTSWVYVSAADGRVTRTRVISEAFGGGTSTVSNDEDE